MDRRRGDHPRAGEQRAREHPDGKWSLDSLRLALAKSKPGIYGKWDNTQLAAMLRKESIPVVTIRIGNKTYKCVRKADVERLMADREARRKGVTPGARQGRSVRRGDTVTGW